MKTKVLSLFSIIVVCYYFFRSFDFLFGNSIEGNELIALGLKMVLAISNLAIFGFIFLFLRNNKLKTLARLCGFLALGLIIYPIFSYLNIAFNLFPNVIDTVFLLAIVLIMITFLISIIVEKRKDIVGLKYLKRASIAFLISMTLGIIISLILKTIGHEEKSNLSLLPLIIPYLYIYKFSKTLRDESITEAPLAGN